MLHLIPLGRQKRSVSVSAALSAAGILGPTRERCLNILVLKIPLMNAIRILKAFERVRSFGDSRDNSTAAFQFKKVFGGESKN